jgi:hypothetical protein
MWAASKRGCLGEESAVHEGRSEIRIGLSFNEDAGAQEVIANREPFQADVNVARRLRQIKGEPSVVPRSRRGVREEPTCHRRHWRLPRLG